MKERIILNINNHLYSNNLLYKYRSGFRPDHSTTYQLIDIFTIFVNPSMQSNIPVADLEGVRGFQ